MKKKEYVEALRKLADFVEAQKFPDTVNGYFDEPIDAFEVPRLTIYARTKQDFSLLAASMGAFKKQGDNWATRMVKELPGGATVVVSAAKERVCKRVVTGRRIIEATLERVTPSVPQHEEDIVEWECPESFIALKDEPEAK